METTERDQLIGRLLQEGNTLSDVQKVLEEEHDVKLTYMGGVESYRERVRCRRTWHWLCNLDDAASRHVEDPRPYYELGSRPVDEIDV